MFLSSKKTKKGFTLVELVIVIIIVGVLTALAVPRFVAVFERMRAAEGAQLLTALLAAQKAFQMEDPNDNYSVSVAALDIEITRSAYFDVGTIVVQNNAGNVAEIDRDGGDYSLFIDEDGIIDCNAGGGPLTCAQAGY